MAPNSITREELKQILKEFINRSIKKDSLRTADLRKVYQGLNMRVSFGQGNQARVSWMAFLGPNQKPINGIYPLVLSNRKNCIVVVYGVSEYIKPDIVWNLKNIPKLKDAKCKCDLTDIKKKFGGSLLEQCIVVNKSDISDQILERIIKSIDKIIKEYKKTLNI